MERKFYKKNTLTPTAPRFHGCVTISHNQKIITVVLASQSTKERTSRNGATNHNLNSFTLKVLCAVFSGTA
jgi:hypothetical protein